MEEKNKIFAYIRVSTDTQDRDKQKLELYEYARKNNLLITDLIEINISTGKSKKKRRIDELVERLSENDVLLVTEISRVGRSTAENIFTVNELMAKGVRLVATKQAINVSKHNMDMQSKMMITMYSLFAEIEKDMISLRTKEALGVLKAKGIQLGKPKGIIQDSLYDIHKDKIKELKQYGLSASKIARMLNLNVWGLRYYMKTRAGEFLQVLA